MPFNKQSPKKGYCGHGHECLPNAKQITALQKWAPEQNRTIWHFFTWPTCLLQNEGSCAHGFAWPKNNVPYKRTPGFYKIQKFYKNTAHLQKHVHKAGLGMQFSYWNAVRKGPQAQPFGSGNFDVRSFGWYPLEKEWTMKIPQHLICQRCSMIFRTNHGISRRISHLKAFATPSHTAEVDALGEHDVHRIPYSPKCKGIMASWWLLFRDIGKHPGFRQQPYISYIYIYVHYTPMPIPCNYMYMCNIH